MGIHPDAIVVNDRLFGGAGRHPTRPYVDLPLSRIETVDEDIERPLTTDGDALGTARGIILGLIIVAPFWLAVAYLLFLNF
jgi:hypothetical protein